MMHYILYSYFVYIIFRLCPMKYNVDMLLKTNSMLYKIVYV